MLFRSSARGEWRFSGSQTPVRGPIKCSRQRQSRGPRLSLIHISWEAAYAEVGGSVTQVADAFGSGFLMDLNDKGKCVVTVDGTNSYGKWTLNGGVFQLDCGGLSCTGTLQDLSLIHIFCLNAWFRC